MRVKTYLLWGVGGGLSAEPPGQNGKRFKRGQSNSSAMMIMQVFIHSCVLVGFSQSDFHGQRDFGNGA